MQNETIVAFILGFVLSGIIYFRENSLLKRQNNYLTKSLENVTGIINTFISLGKQEINKNQENKEGEK